MEVYNGMKPILDKRLWRHKIMADLINFVTLLNGKFDNKDQFEK